MSDLLFSTRRAAEAARLEFNDVQKLFSADARCEGWIADSHGAGISRQWTPRQVMLLRLHGYLVRFGFSIPRAGLMVTRIAETLCGDPEADTVFIEQRANGAMFYATDGEASDAAKAAGEVQSRFAINLAGHRRAVEAAANARVRLIGGDDD